MITAKERYVRRCEEDERFFFRNEISIRPKAKVEGGLVNLHPNTGQERVISAIDALERDGRPVRMLILKARQWGSSTLCQAYVIHRSRFRPYHDALCIGNRDATTKKLMAMNRLMHSHLSPALTEGWERKISQTDKNYEWTNGSILQIDTAGQPEASRGATRDFIHGSEVAFWPKGGSVLDAMLPGIPYLPGTAVVLESTSNGASGMFWELWQGSKEDDFSKWARIFVPWSIHHEYEDEVDPDLAALGERAAAGDESALDTIGWLSDDERQWLLSGDLNLGQVHWRKRTIATNFKGREEQFRREYPLNEEEAFEAASGGFLDDQGLKLQNDGIDRSFERYDVMDSEEGKPLSDPTLNPLVLTAYGERPAPEKGDNGWIHVFEKPKRRQIYTMGVDPAEGLGADFSAFVVRHEGKIVCVGQRNDISTDLFAGYLYCIGHWYNDATLNVERAGGGMAVINTLLRLGYPRLYATEQFDDSGERHGKRVGFNPSSDNVRTLLSLFRHACNTGTMLLKYPRLVSEAKWTRLITRTRKDGTTSYVWGCPGKGRNSANGERISDDLFRAAALTEPVARDYEWIRAIESEYAELEKPKIKIKQEQEFDFHNPIFESKEETRENTFIGEDGVVQYDPFEISAEDLDEDNGLPLP